MDLSSKVELGDFLNDPKIILFYLNENKNNVEKTQSQTPGEPIRGLHSPFYDDEHPSFALYFDNETQKVLFKDYGTPPLESIKNGLKTKGDLIAFIENIILVKKISLANILEKVYYKAKGRSRNYTDITIQDIETYQYQEYEKRNKGAITHSILSSSPIGQEGLPYFGILSSAITNSFLSSSNKPDGTICATQAIKKVYMYAVTTPNKKQKKLVRKIITPKSPTFLFIGKNAYTYKEETPNNETDRYIKASAPEMLYTPEAKEKRWVIVNTTRNNFFAYVAGIPGYYYSKNRRWMYSEYYYRATPENILEYPVPTAEKILLVEGAKDWLVLNYLKVNNPEKLPCYIGWIAGNGAAKSLSRLHPHIKANITVITDADRVKNDGATASSLTLNIDGISETTLPYKLFNHPGVDIVDNKIQYTQQSGDTVHLKDLSDIITYIPGNIETVVEYFNSVAENSYNIQRLSTFGEGMRALYSPEETQVPYLVDLHTLPIISPNTLTLLHGTKGSGKSKLLENWITSIIQGNIHPQKQEGESFSPEDETPQQPPYFYTPEGYYNTDTSLHVLYIDTERSYNSELALPFNNIIANIAKHPVTVNQYFSAHGENEKTVQELIGKRDIQGFMATDYFKRIREFVCFDERYFTLESYSKLAFSPAHQKQKQLVEHIAQFREHIGSAPLIVFIDIATDFIGNENNIEESKRFAEFITKLSNTNNTAVVCTAHTVHSQNSPSKATGHLGSALARKATTVIELTDPGTIDINLDVRRSLQTKIREDSLFTLFTKKYKTSMGVLTYKNIRSHTSLHGTGFGDSLRTVLLMDYTPNPLTHGYINNFAFSSQHSHFD